MANTHTGISWTDATWSPVTGCSHVSDGCKFCYAEELSLRRGWSRKPWGAQNAAENVVLHPERLDAPMHWRKPKKIFVNSMSDLWHEQIPMAFIAEVFARMAWCPQHTFQILTKRPERMRQIVNDPAFPEWVNKVMAIRAGQEGWCACELPEWPLHNVWLGVSAEAQREADYRLPILMDTDAAIRYVSYEPALSQVDWGSLTYVKLSKSVHSDTVPFDPLPRLVVAPAGIHKADLNPHGAVSAWTLGGWLGIKPTEYEWVRKIDWLICGGESGPHHRPFDLEWARQARDQCKAAKVAFFFKQVGGRTPKAGGDLLDGIQWHQFPEAT